MHEWKTWIAARRCARIGLAPGSRGLQVAIGQGRKCCGREAGPGGQGWRPHGDCGQHHRQPVLRAGGRRGRRHQRRDRERHVRPGHGLGLGRRAATAGGRRSAARHPDGWCDHRLQRHPGLRNRLRRQPQQRRELRAGWGGWRYDKHEHHHVELSSEEILHRDRQGAGHPRRAVHHVDHQQRSFHHRARMGWYGRWRGCGARRDHSTARWSHQRQRQGLPGRGHRQQLGSSGVQRRCLSFGQRNRRRREG